jgi:hypothetical protein
MRWWVAWDGTRLFVVKRPSRLVWLGAALVALAAPGWYALARDEGTAWHAGGTLLLAAFAGSLVTLGVRGYRRVEASEAMVRADRLCVPAAEVKVMTVRRETRRYSNQWGRGEEVVGILFVGLAGGRTVDLVTLDGTALEGRAGRELSAGLTALPYGRPPR